MTHLKRTDIELEREVYANQSGHEATPGPQANARLCAVLLAAAKPSGSRPVAIETCNAGLSLSKKVTEWKAGFGGVR